MKILFFLVFISIPLIPEAQNPCGDSLESLPTRHRGRVKPLLVHAGETLHYLVGKKTLPPHSATEAYCLLSLESLGFPSNLEPTVAVEHSEARELLGLAKGESISLRDLPDEVITLRMALGGVKEEGPYKKALEKLLGQAMVFQQLIDGRHWSLPLVIGNEIQWMPLVTLGENPGAANLDFLFKKLETNFLETAGDSHLLELRMVKMRLPTVAMVFTLTGLALLVLLRSLIWPVIFTILTLCTQITLILMRILVSGRAPVTNMYETVLFSGLGALALGILVALGKKEKAFLFGGLAYNALTLMMISFATGMLSESINPLVPVLRDNFWLSTHVTTVVFSYGALGLSWILANTVLLRKKFGSLSSRDMGHFCDVIYTCLKYGTVLLAAGVILGGVWADYSWGRFWGWDPKETWSLIVLCLYMAILHGRYTNWIGPTHFVPLTALAFLSVLMAWFGVNYILASGLHSYGFSEGGALFLSLVFGGQFLVLGITRRAGVSPS